jgi:hypothetical protein
VLKITYISRSNRRFRSKSDRRDLRIEPRYLIVDPNAVLAFPVSLERFQSISRWATQVVQMFSSFQLIQLSRCDSSQAAPQFILPGYEEGMGVPALEGLNHFTTV